MKILIVFPVYNEESVLRTNVLKTLDFCRQKFSDFKIVIADNASTDRSAAIGSELAGEFGEIDYFFVSQKGKGNAWRSAFLREPADVYVFMDIDLSVDLAALERLIKEIENGNSLVFGSRFIAGAQVERGIYRRIISWLYRGFARLVLNLPARDLQCGFKALDNRAKELLRQTKDDGFFLDTEFIFLAHKNGLRIKEVPVTWKEGAGGQRKSKVNIWGTGFGYLKKMVFLAIDKH